jgi:acetyl-CoA carboxylase carboxyltransferase component
MPQPNGYRKALRFMKHADKFGFPIVTFVDTPGAYAGKNAEELGQGEVRDDHFVISRESDSNRGRGQQEHEDTLA